MTDFTNNYYLKEKLILNILKKLNLNSNLTQRNLSKELNVSLGSINYSLKSLMLKGYVKVQNFKKSDNKLSYMYILTPKGIAQKLELTQRFLKIKQLEYKEIKKEIVELKKELNRGN
tara:strand:- start:137 stop:487 length:351 start_codon:yes stop_codon:yes gene_type:complete